MIQGQKYQNYFSTFSTTVLKPSSGTNHVFYIALSGEIQSLPYTNGILDDYARKIDGIAYKEWSSKGV